MKTFKIDSEYITITQFLKANGFIGSGGEAKYFLADNKVFINGSHCFERGKKVRVNDEIKLLNETYKII